MIRHIFAVTGKSSFPYFECCVHVNMAALVQGVVHVYGM